MIRMNWAVKKYLYTCTLLTVFSCSQPQKYATEQEWMEIPLCLNQKENVIGMSEFVESIHYVALETTSDCLLGNIDKMIITEHGEYVMVDMNKAKSIYVFDENGRFKCRIGSRGQGPNEYMSLTDVSYYENKVYVWDSASEKILEYGLDNSFVASYSFTHTAYSMACIGDGKFAFGCDYVHNAELLSDDGYPSLMLFDALTKEITPLIHFDKNVSSLGYMATLNNLCGNNFYLPLNDTIYQVGKDGLRRKRVLSYKDDYKERRDDYVKESKRRQLTSDDAMNSFFKGGYPHLITYFGNGNFDLLFLRMNDYLYYGFYDSNTKTYKEASSQKYPIKNDLDGVADFIPRFVKDNYIFTLTEPSKLLEYKPALAEKMGIEEDGNPIIAKMRIKMQGQ